MSWNKIPKRKEWQHTSASGWGDLDLNKGILIIEGDDGSARMFSLGINSLSVMRDSWGDGTGSPTYRIDISGRVSFDDEVVILEPKDLKDKGDLVDRFGEILVENIIRELSQ